MSKTCHSKRTAMKIDPDADLVELAIQIGIATPNCDCSRCSECSDKFRAILAEAERRGAAKEREACVDILSAARNRLDKGGLFNDLVAMCIEQLEDKIRARG